MRIITGAFKGKSLKSLDDRSIRPVTDRVKTTIYNMLQNRLRLTDAVVLDLYAGSGSLGFEALSRGARSVVFVDDAGEALDILERNATALGCMDDCEIIQCDALSFIDKTREKFDLIFADPPYAYGMTNEIPAKIFRKNILTNQGYLIIEHTKNLIFAKDDIYHIAATKEFGTTHISFFTHPLKEES
jgi:16S rRNA (guanine966-N2)-methyltransferase